MDADTGAGVGVEPDDDPFIKKANDELARLFQEEAQLAEREAEVRRERAAHKLRIEALQKSLQMYREVMGLAVAVQSAAYDTDHGFDSTIADRAYQLMRSRGGRMRVAEIADELAALRGDDGTSVSKSDYATVYSSLARDARFTKAAPGEFQLGPTDEEVLREVADRQMRDQPPGRFVGLNFLAEQRGWQAKLADLIKRGLLVTYQVANPKTPEHPVTAIRVNDAAPEVRRMLGGGASELDGLDYETAKTA